MSAPDTFDWSKIVEAFACNARVEAMKAANMQRQTLGQSMAYDDKELYGEAATLDSIAGLLLERSRYG